MKLTVIDATNFLSHSHSRVEFNGDRLSTFSGANGAGKSALLEALLYTLYDAARGRTDDLVRLGSSEMAVTVEFEFGGSEYRVSRGRSTRAGGKSFLELQVRDGAAWRPLTAESIRETQAAIAELLRLDADTFATAAFLKQGEADRFISATAGDRKKILATVLGLDRYERARERAGDLARGVDAGMTAGRQQLERFDEQLGDRQAHADAVDHYRAQLADLAEQRTEHVNELARFREERTALAVKEAELAAARADVVRLERELGTHTDAYKAARQRGNVADQQRARARTTLAQAERIEEAAGRIRVLEEQLAAARAAVDEYQRAEQAAEQAASRRQDAERDVATVERRLADLVAQREDTITCPSCGAEIPAGGEGLEVRIRNAEDDVVGAKHDLGVLPSPGELPPKPDVDPWRISEQLTEARGIAAGAAALTEAQSVVEEATAAIEAATSDAAAAEKAGKATRRALDAAKVRIAQDTTARAIEVADERIGHHEQALALAEEAITSATASLAKAEAALEQLAAVQKERNALAATLETAAGEFELLRRLVAAFGPNGIPARIIESVLPELGRYANELLEQLRPGMTLDIRAQRAKRDGGMAEALDLVVRDDAGERGLAMFSGGERMSVALALAVGLSRLVARRAGTAIRTLVVDEPDGLDVDARRAFGAALRILAHHGDLERVLVVSHHEDLAEIGDAMYAVTKDAAGSHVELVS